VKQVRSVVQRGMVLAAAVTVVAAGVHGATQDARSGEEARVDLLTFAQGALFVSQAGMGTGSAANALAVVDGSVRKVTLSSDGRGPVTLVYKLPAATRFDRFAVPNVLETPGNATFFRSVTIDGSADGPEGPYTELATAELTTHGPDETMTEITPATVTPVRWVRVHLADGINVEAGDEGRTNLEFTELIGNGTQDDRSLSTAFDGLWEFRLAERLDLRGEPFRLAQEGTTVTGCLDDTPVQGTVTGAIARLSGASLVNGRPSAMLLVADEDGTIHGALSRNGGVFGARTAVEVPEPAEPCDIEAAPEPSVCGVSVYVNFDLDSAAIRPDSEQVLADLHTRLTREAIDGVTIVGHTSTEGSEAYNLDLSQRRAEAVVAALTARGYPAASISARSEGEARPLVSPDDNEAARSLNRRVEVVCQ